MQGTDFAALDCFTVAACKTVPLTCIYDRFGAFS